MIPLQWCLAEMVEGQPCTEICLQLKMSWVNISRDENTLWYKKTKINTWNDTAVDSKSIKCIRSYC